MSTESLARDMATLQDLYEQASAMRDAVRSQVQTLSTVLMPLEQRVQALVDEYEQLTMGLAAEHDQMVLRLAAIEKDMLAKKLAREAEMDELQRKIAAAMTTIAQFVPQEGH